MIIHYFIHVGLLSEDIVILEIVAIINLRLTKSIPKKLTNITKI